MATKLVSKNPRRESSGADIKAFCVYLSKTPAASFILSEMTIFCGQRSSQARQPMHSDAFPACDNRHANPP